MRHVVLTFCLCLAFGVGISPASAAPPAAATPTVRTAAVVPALSINSLRATPEVFYPVVRDGYLDETTVRFSVNQNGARVRAEVIRPDTGRVIRTALVDSYTLAGYGEEWEWSGLTDAGTSARPGRYRVRITVTNDSGVTSTDSVWVQIRHGRFLGTQRYDFGGNKTDRRHRSRSCYINGYGGELTLDCWGGRSARVDYLFRVPRDAHDLSWRIDGHRNCCDRGRIVKTGDRVSPTRFRISVLVTGWRSFTIERVRFSYSARMMFRPQVARR